MATGLYNYVYLVQPNAVALGSFNIVSVVLTGVSVAANTESIAVGQDFNATNNLGLDLGSFQYVSGAFDSIPGDTEGFIAQDLTNKAFYYFTNTPFLGSSSSFATELFGLNSDPMPILNNEFSAKYASMFAVSVTGVPSPGISVRANVLDLNGMTLPGALFSNVTVTADVPKVPDNGIFTVFNGHQNLGGFRFIDATNAGGADHDTHMLGGYLVQNLQSSQYFVLTNGIGLFTGGSIFTPALGNLSGIPPDQELPVCFYRGTQILMGDGSETSVELLVRGDLVRTRDGRQLPIEWIGRQTCSWLKGDPLSIWPIRIRASGLGLNVPKRDLLVSPCHAVGIDNILVQAGALVNGTSIVRETPRDLTVDYFHIELASHELISAEGCPAETFVDNIDRMRFDNWDEHAALWPDGRSIQELPFPRAKSYRQVPRPIRAMLAKRAQERNVVAA